MKKVFIVIVALIFSLTLFSVVKAEMTSSQFVQLHNKFLNSLNTCTPVKVYIPGEDCYEIGFTGQKVCDNGYTREVIGKEGNTCKVIDNNRKCYFPLSITSKLSNGGKKITNSIESGNIDISSSDPSIIWAEQMYNKYCSY
ncbi:MAG: hypothetical protein E7Z89_00050 [Cyanobacteria bacterium SIG28]|nr:hypothetical protein [Cyanobacteria bacterium SIG28]